MTQEPLTGEVIPPQAGSQLAATEPTLAFGLVLAVKYWGVARAMNRFRVAIDAEAAATRAIVARNEARADLTRSLERMANLDAIRQTEREKIQADARQSEGALKRLAHELKRDAARAELEALQAQDALAAYKKKRKDPYANDPMIGKINELVQQARWHEYVEKAKQGLREQYGDPPPPHIQQIMDQIDDRVASAAMLSDVEGR